MNNNAALLPLDPHDIAMGYYHRHQAEHLNTTQLVGMASLDIQRRRTDLTAYTADQAAVRAWASFEAKDQPWFLDLADSTPHCVVLRGTNGQPTRILTLGDLIAAADMLRAKGRH